MDIINSTLHSVVSELIQSQQATQAERYLLLLLNLIQDLRMDVDHVLLCLLTTQRDHLLHPTFLTPTQRRQILQKGRLVSSQLNLDIPFDDPASLLNIPTSFTTKGSSITFFMHVPLTTRKSFRLWHLLPFPIQMAPNSTTFHLSSRHHAIAVNPAGEYLEFTQAELSACLKIEEQFFCPSTALLTSYNDTCLGRLFQGSTSFLDLCDLTPTQSSWQLHLTNHGLYSFSAFPRTVDAWYTNGSVVVLPWEGYMFWQTQNCTLKSQMFVLEHLPNAYSSMKIQAAPLQLANSNRTSASDVLKKLQHRLERSLPSRVHVALDQPESSDWLTTTLSACALTLAICCIGSIVAYFVYTRKKEKEALALDISSRQ